ncbi:hypothetical protein AB0N09_30825 [Streptomyces erythrochromogenes]|uniref:hypothetical protein n=1 Tax=Streptomyces erythrochromogenes TaxID=285574 RepID=UPI00342C8DD6
MSRSDSSENLTLPKMASLLGVARQAVAGWHADGAIAEFGAPAQDDPVLYPRSAAIAFGQAKGLLLTVEGAAEILQAEPPTVAKWLTDPANTAKYGAPAAQDPLLFERSVVLGFGQAKERVVTVPEFAELLGTARQTVDRWHASGAIGKVGEPVLHDPLVYPRSVAVRFGQAIGFLGLNAEPIEMDRVGRWLPDAPTISPEDTDPKTRFRFYLNHVGALFNVSHDVVKSWAHQRPSSTGQRPHIKGGSKDEVGRLYYTAAELAAFAKRYKRDIDVTAVPEFARAGLVVPAESEPEKQAGREMPVALRVQVGALLVRRFTDPLSVEKAQPVAAAIVERVLLPALSAEEEQELLGQIRAALESAAVRPEDARLTAQSVLEQVVHPLVVEKERIVAARGDVRRAAEGKGPAPAAPGQVPLSLAKTVLADLLSDAFPDYPSRRIHTAAKDILEEVIAPTLEVRAAEKVLQDLQAAIATHVPADQTLAAAKAVAKAVTSPLLAARNRYARTVAEARQAHGKADTKGAEKEAPRCHGCGAPWQCPTNRVLGGLTG